LNIITNLI